MYLVDSYRCQAVRIYRFVEDVHRYQFQTMCETMRRRESNLSQASRVTGTGSSGTSSFSSSNPPDPLHSQEVNSSSFLAGHTSSSRGQLEEMSPQLKNTELRSKRRAHRIAKLLRFMLFATCVSVLLMTIFSLESYVAYQVYINNLQYWFQVEGFDNLIAPVIEPFTIYVCLIMLMFAFRKPKPIPRSRGRR